MSRKAGSLCILLVIILAVAFALVRGAYFSPVRVEQRIELPTPHLITQATVGGKVEQVRQMLDADPTLLAYRDETGEPLLFTAVTFGHKEIVELLLDRGLSPNDTCQTRTLEGKTIQYTLLMTAAEKGNLPMVKLLLARGADPLFRAEDGRRASDMAEEMRYPKIAEELRREEQKGTPK